VRETACYGDRETTVDREGSCVLAEIVGETAEFGEGEDEHVLNLAVGGETFVAAY
jgi:hypothetical protein